MLITTLCDQSGLIVSCGHNFFSVFFPTNKTDRHDIHVIEILLLKNDIRNTYDPFFYHFVLWNIRNMKTNPN